MNKNKRFPYWKIDVTGLSKKEARLKRKRAEILWLVHSDLKESIKEDYGKDKCRRKTHVSRSFVKEHIDLI